MNGKTNVKKTSGKINGIIKKLDVLSGNTISSGDFVSLINNINVGSDVVINNENNSATKLFALKLEEEKVLLIYGADKIEAMIITINESGIVCGTPILLANKTIYNDRHVASVLSDGRIFMPYTIGGGTCYLYAMVLAVDGTAITIDIDEIQLDGGYSGLSCESLAGNKIFIVQGTTSIFAYIFEVGSNTITNITSATNIGSTSNSIIKTTKVNDTEIAVAYGKTTGSRNSSLTGVKVFISNDYSISSGGENDFAWSNYTGNYFAMCRGDNYIFMAYNYGGSLYIYTWGDSGVSQSGSRKYVGSDNYSGSYFSVVKIKSGKFVIVCSATSQYGLCFVLVNMSNVFVEESQTIQLSTGYYSANYNSIIPTNGNVCIMRANSYSELKIKGILCKILEATNINDSQNIDGVAISNQINEKVKIVTI